MKRIIAIVLSLVIIITGTGVIRFQITEAEAISDSFDNGEKRSSVNDIKHVQGEALIEISMNPGEDSELIHAGVLASDPTITIKNVMCFDGDKSHPEKKTYIVSVKSGRYSAKSLITKFKKYKNVVRTAYNSCRKMLKSMGNNDPFFKYQWHLGGERFFGEDSTYVKDADLSYEPETRAPTDKDVPIVVVVDTGVDYTQEDLKNKMWENPYPKSELPGKYGYDCGCDDDDPMPEKSSDHGTNVASVIAAETDNGVGISGVSRYAKIMALKAITDEGLTTDRELMAYEYIYKAQKLGANIVAVNCSFGGIPSDVPDPEIDETIPMLDLATERIGAMGAVLVYAGGNEYADTDVMCYGTPAQLNPTYLIRVGATTPNDTKAPYSNYGKKSVDIMAPGSAILMATHQSIYEPSLLSEQQRKEKCVFYETFDTAAKDGFMTIDQITGKEESFLSVEHTKEDFFGSKKSGSERVYIKKKKNPTANAYCLYYDVTGLPIDPLENLHISFKSDNTFDESENVDWGTLEHSLLDSKIYSLFTFRSRTYLRLDLNYLLGDMTYYLGNYFYFDNLSLSKYDTSVDPIARYAFDNGTSFSAPIVAGALARLAVLFPEDNALTRKAKLLASVKKKPQYEEKCATGGTLDLSKLADQKDIHVDAIVYKVSSVKLNKTKATLKVGKKLTMKVNILPEYAENTGVTWKVSNKKYASVSSSGVVKAKKKGKGHTVTVTATAKDGSGKKASCKITIK